MNGNGIGNGIGMGIVRGVVVAVVGAAGLGMGGCAGSQHWAVGSGSGVGRAASSEEAVTVAVPGATLHGTMLVPAGNGRHAVALIIAGSGPTDRDGNSKMLPGANNSLKQLAEGLAANGIASVRYDKRGIGASAAGFAGESELRFTTFSDDAAAWIAQLQRDKRFSKVVVIGHSEGALLGTLAARQAHADGLVLIAGAGRPVGEVLREQLRAGAPAILPRLEPILKELEAGRRVADVPADLQFLVRQSIQPYMISWLPLDPRAELARVEVPRMVVQGTTDAQASPVDAQRLASADKSVRLEMIEGMNHVFKMASGTAAQQMASYSDASLQIAPRLVEAVAQFIRTQIL